MKDIKRTMRNKNGQEKLQRDIREYYGKVLKTKQDIKTSACCTAETLPHYIREIVKEIHPEIQDKFYGCGSPIPGELHDRVVLDLGCGSGRDCYILSKLVGPKGHVIGVDMTEEQLSIAARHLDSQMNRFGFSESNVEFLQGYIEDLKGLGIKDNSVDAVISNCVINLSPDKERVFSEIFRVLRPGGELYFSDVFADRRIPGHLAEDPELLGECLGGALYIQDFRRLLLCVGCSDYRVVSQFKAGQPVLVCGNTASMLTRTRYARHFKVIGDTSTHYGLFACGPSVGQSLQENKVSGSCC